jgi:predicted DNA-binding protein (UPF0251 family)
MKEVEIIELLKSYSVCKKFLDAQAYAKEYFNHNCTKLTEKDTYETRIHVIESLIKLLEPSDEYTLLHLHYIKGVPIGKCAECMSVSSRTAFRKLNNAYKSIYELISKKERSTDERAD